MEKYQEPSLEIIRFDQADIITESGGDEGTVGE